MAPGQFTFTFICGSKAFLRGAREEREEEASMTPSLQAAAPDLERDPPSATARAVTRIHVHSVCSGLSLQSGLDICTRLETSEACTEECERARFPAESGVPVLRRRLNWCCPHSSSCSLRLLLSEMNLVFGISQTWVQIQALPLAGASPRTSYAITLSPSLPICKMGQSLNLPQILE